MKKILSIALVFMGISLTSLAQDRKESGVPEIRAKKQTERMTGKLGLNDEQAGKVYDINLKAARQMIEAKDKGGNMKEIQQKKDEELKMVLTPEQMKKYEEVKMEMKAKRMEKTAE